MIEKIEKPVTPLELNSKINEIIDNIAGKSIGEIISVACGKDYVPEGCLPCDGTEYTKNQFPDLWKNYLTSETYSLNAEIEYSDGTIQTDGTLITSNITVKGNSISDEVVFCLKLNTDVQTKKYITGNSGAYIENDKVYNSDDDFIIDVFENGNLYIKTTISENTPSTEQPQAYKISYYYSNNNSTFVENPTVSGFSNSIEFFLLNGVNFPIDLTKSYLNSTPIVTLKTLLNTCTYEDYATDFATYGQCGKFAIDSENEKFKVPLIKDGAVIQQALSDSELGKSYNESLPNIRGTFGNTSFPLTPGNATDTVSGSVYVVSRKKADQSITVGGTSQNTAREIGINANLSSSVYQDNAKVQGDNIRFRFFVVVANGTTNQSQMDWSAWASGLQSKLNKDHSNDEKPYVKETYIHESTGSGYRIWSDGYCEQWGRTVTNTTSWFSISLLKKYSNTIYGCLASNTGSSDTIYNVKTGNNDKNTTTSLYLKCNNSSTNVCWKTFGYLAEGEY